MSVFDAYLIVDWSANSRPKKGADSIWYCLSIKDQGAVIVKEPRNPSTRCTAITEIRGLIRDLSRRGLRILVGFDFPFAYPAGFADRLGLSGPAPWRLIWELLRSRISDLPDNRNNRFQIASRLNEQITGAAAPFWACPNAAATRFLRPTKQRDKWPEGIAEYRVTDTRIRGPHSPWKLYTTGSVGSQTLMGIPSVHQLRYDPELEAISMVWPFETGFCLIQRIDSAKVVFAEVYPSLITARVAEGEIKDRVQVQTLCAHFERLDEIGELSSMFDCPHNMSDADRKKAEREEGWILGVR